MKRITLLFASALVGCSAFCGVLTPEAALNRAMSTTTVRHIKSVNSVSPELVTTFSAENEPAVYLFTRGNNNGYLVVSADDSTDAILGYCDEGSFNLNSMPDAMKYLLESYADQIAYARKNAPATRVEHQSPVRAAIHPMCETTWAQSTPYNDKCPNQYPTGCVATALAQVLKYYNYPTKGSGTMSYNWNGQNLSYNFDENTFKWDEMLNAYNTGNPTDAQKEAVADLMYACGVAVQMNYKSGGSGAYPINGISNLVNKFGMDKGIRYYSRDYYRYDEWNDLIYDALVNGGPVMLGGCIVNLSTTYAHEFVCDGYADNDMFHINWGWGGGADGYNGYFRLNALNAYSNGIVSEKNAYHYYQDALCYIQPPVEGSKVYEQLYCNGFSIQNTSANLGSSITLNGGALNYSGAAISGNLGIKISDINGEVIEYVASANSFNNVNIAGSIGNATVKLPSDLEEGTYTVTPAFKGTDGEWHDVICKVASVNSYTMNVSDGKAKFSSDGVGSITVSDFKLDTPFYKTDTSKSYTYMARFSAKVSCPSDNEYYGKIALALYDTKGNKQSTWSYIPVFIPAGETQDIEIYESSSVVNEGSTYQIGVVDASGNLLSELETVTIETGSPSKSWKASVTDLTFKNADAVDKHDIEMSFTLSCSSGFLFEPVWFTVYDPNDEIVIQWPIYPVAMVEGETKYYTHHVDFAEGIAGTTYRVYPLSGVNAKWLSTTKVTFTIAEETVSAVKDISADNAEVVSIEYYTLQGVNIGANVTEPGLYIKAEKLSNGESRTTRCIIR